MNNYVRDAMRSAMNKWLETFMGGDRPSFMDVAQWGIDYQTKRLAETAGQEFPAHFTMRERYTADQVIDIQQNVIERTAASFAARIAELEAQLENRK